MPLIQLAGVALNVQLLGPADAPALVLLHALGTDLSLWDGILPQLGGYRVLCLDLRGHGASEVPPPPYRMGALVRDVEAAMDHFGLTEAVGIGVSLGGLILQGLATKRLDLIRGMVLSNSAARIGGPGLWQARIAEVGTQGLAAYAPGALHRMLGRQWQSHPARPRLEAMLTGTDPQGWIGCANAIGGADFFATTAALRLPSLVIAGGLDGTTPPDLVRETADLIPGHRWHLFPRLGHLPMLEAPEDFAAVLLDFLHAIGHRTPG